MEIPRQLEWPSDEPREIIFKSNFIECSEVIKKIYNFVVDEVGAMSSARFSLVMEFSFSFFHQLFFLSVIN